MLQFASFQCLITARHVTKSIDFGNLQDFLNMYFRNIYKPLPLVYNLVLSMIWRHPEKVELEKVKVVHYCEAVSDWYMCNCRLPCAIHTHH